MIVNNIFVFVVCGSKEHIDTLHFSLRYLKHFSKNSIWIVTDSSRNQMPIIHDAIIEIETPKQYNHHQASIYLKTGLYKFLPSGNNYCYLDTDVIALSFKCNEIFEQFIPPIRFAADHCLTYHFSPHAINCGCLEKLSSSSKLLSSLIEKQKPKQIFDEYLHKEAKLLEKEFERIKSNFFLRAYFSLKFKLPLDKIWLNKRYYFDRKEQAWKVISGEIIMYDINITEMEEKTGYHFVKDENRWIGEFGFDYWHIGCTHLVEKIKQTFGIDVADNLWQHWNGGVFLFNDTSKDFLESWHKKNLKIFELPEWKTRDQGTLIATAWEFNLQHQPVLSKEWNFLADDNNPDLGFDNEGCFTENNWSSKYKVNFAHIYHRFGDTTWELWNFIANKTLNDN